MFTRFNNIVKNLEALGKTFSNGKKLRKILRSQPKAWDPKVIAIEKSKDLDNLSFDDLIGSLMTQEIMMKRDDNEINRDENLLLKVSHSSSDDDDDDDNDLMIISRKCKRFIRRKKLKELERINLRKRKDKFEGEKYRNGVKCYGCQKYGHIIFECPSFKRYEKEFKKKMDDSSSSDESQVEEMVNLCLMTNIEENPSHSSDLILSFTLDEFHDALNDLMNEFENISMKNNVLKKT